MNDDISSYNNGLFETDKTICNILRQEIDQALPESTSKIWHGAPVWFINGNPTVGYSKLKDSVRLMFWSGADFEEKDLKLGSGKFKDAHIDYTSANQISTTDITRYIEKSKVIQWNYKDIIKHKGKLERL